MRTAIVLVGLLGVAALAAAPAVAAPADGSTTQTNASLNTTVQWSTVVEDADAFPAAAGDRVYVAAGNRVYALDRTNGDRAWAKRFGDADNTSFASAPVVGPDTVYAIDRADDSTALYALDRETGDVKWTLDSLEVAGRPVVDGDTVVFADTGNETHVRAHDADTGTEQWRYAVGSVTDYLAVDGHVYVAGNDTLVKINATAGGDGVWRRGHGAGALSYWNETLVGVTYADLLDSDGEGDVVRWSTESGRPLERVELESGGRALVDNPLFRSGYPRTSLQGDRLYVVDRAIDDASWVGAYDLSTGEELFNTTVAPSGGVDELANGVPLVYGDDGHVRALDRATGRVTADATVIGSPFVGVSAADGSYYLGTASGTVYASTVSIRRTHSSGVSAPLFDAVAGSDGRFSRAEMLDTVRAYLTTGSIENEPITRDDMLALVRYYVTG
jgi:outer membrane protein assembly factor BamB